MKTDGINRPLVLSSMQLPELFGLFNGYRACYRRAYHGIVAHTDKPHHFNVCGNGRRTCELCVAVHPAHGVRHAVACGTGRHIVGVQSSSRAAAAGNREIFLAVVVSPFLIRAGNGMLEAGGVGGIAGYGYVHVLEERVLWLFHRRCKQFP